MRYNLSGKKKRWLIAGIVFLLLVALVVGLSFLGEAMAHHAANDPYCETLDFGGDDCMVDVKIYNDTHVTYVVKQCIGSFSTPACKVFNVGATLQSGQGTKAPGTTENDPPQPWMIFDVNGKTVGCIDLRYTKNVERPVIAPLSKLISCKSFL